MIGTMSRKKNEVVVVAPTKQAFQLAKIDDFDKKTVKTLEKIEWWSWPIDYINSNIKYLCSGDIKKIIELSDNLQGSK